MRPPLVKFGVAGSRHCSRMRTPKSRLKTIRHLRSRPRTKEKRLDPLREVNVRKSCSGSGLQHNQVGGGRWIFAQAKHRRSRTRIMLAGRACEIASMVPSQNGKCQFEAPSSFSSSRSSSFGVFF
jgi:hypothetical protein